MIQISLYFLTLKRDFIDWKEAYLNPRHQAAFDPAIKVERTSQNSSLK
jgi:hypothetical protein